MTPAMHRIAPRVENTIVRARARGMLSPLEEGVEEELAPIRPSIAVAKKSITGLWLGSVFLLFE